MAHRPNRQRLLAIGILATAVIALPIYAAATHGRAAPGTPLPPRVDSATLRSQIVVAPAAATPAPAPHPTPSVTPARVAAATPLVVRHILDTGGAIPYGRFFWDEDGAPAGPLVITVDLAAETISAFRDGYEIGTAAVIFGDAGRETPLGTFPITQKDAHHVSNLYHAPMPYMLRLTNDGISIHASDVRYDYATHGCIGVPLGFAKKLFAAAKLGDRVIVTRGKSLSLGQAITRT